MNDKDKKALDNYKKRMKKQNDFVKENYERMGAVFPKGTKERILAQGYSINSFIIEAVIAMLEILEHDPTKK